MGHLVGHGGHGAAETAIHGSTDAAVVRRGRQGDSGEGRPAWSPTGSVPDRFLNRGGDGRVSLHCSHC